MSRAVIRISTLCMKCVYLFIYETPEFQGTSLCLCSMVGSRQETWTRTPVGDYECMYSYSLEQCIYFLSRRVGYWFGVIDIFTTMFRNLKLRWGCQLLCWEKMWLLGLTDVSSRWYLQAVKLTMRTFCWGSINSDKQKRHLSVGRARLRQPDLEETVRCTAGPAGGINTCSHSGFFSDPETFTDGRRAQKLLFYFWVQKVYLHSCLSSWLQQWSAEVSSIGECVL